MLKILAFMLTLFPMILSAEVFSLWPFSGAGGTVDDALKPLSLWTERIIVDGHPLEMGISLLQNDFKTCEANLRKLHPDASFAANRNSVLVEIKLKNGIRRRLYLLALEGVYPAILFSMDLPPGKLSPGEWPAEFPLPGGAVPVSVMRFPQRDAVYGAFTSQFESGQVLGDLAASLKTAGWESVSAEHQDPFSGTGEVFLKDSASEILVIGFTPQKKGGCLGTLYKRKLK